MRPFLFLLAAVLVLLTACGGGSTHKLDGSVLIFHDRNIQWSGDRCQGRGDLFDLASGNPVKITPRGHDPIFTKLSDGAKSPEGHCRLTFTASLPEADSYVFEIAGRQPLRRDRIPTRPGSGEWWVTFDWDGTSEVPRP